MGPSFRARRFIAFALVLTLHAGLWLVFVAVTRLPRMFAATANVVASLILVPAAKGPDRRQPLKAGADTLRPLRLPVGPGPPVVTPPSAVLPPIAERSAVDWDRAARLGVSRMLEEQHKKLGSSGTAPPSAAAPGSMFAASAHHKGEQVRTDTGGFDVWMNDHCYLADRAPISNVPEHIINPIPVCLPRSGALIPKDMMDIRRALDARFTSSLP